VTEGEICRFRREPFIKLLTKFDDFEQHFFREVSNELAEAQKHVMILGQKDAMERVASFLLMLDERENRYGAHDDIELPMTRAEIADYLGLTIETVSRMLTKLRKSGVIATPNAHLVRIVDPKGLRDIASA
jgi:CRP/FNR family transcriptional regulator